jgi:4-amino-4-deoxy-L-arabinose transferase-like glycosyltransferase
LLKGPVILAVLGATALALCVWDRDRRWLTGTKPLPGVALALAIVAPWASAIAFASHGAFYQQSLGHDFAAKIMAGRESHGAPPGYYLALSSLTFWPATLLLLPAIALAVRNRAEPATRFLLAWSGATWLLFECVPTKLPHYILPAYPALALLAACWATQAPECLERGWDRIFRGIAGAQFALVLILLAGSCVLLPTKFGGTVQPSLLIGVTVGFAVGCAGVILLWRRRTKAAAAAGLASALFFDLVLAWGVTPQLHTLWLSSHAAELVAAHRGPDKTPVVLDGYVEPSLVFLLGSDTRIEPARGAAQAAEETGLALVENRVQPLFLSDLNRLGAAAVALGRVSGLDYSTGREQHITLYRVMRPRPRALKS